MADKKKKIPVPTPKPLFIPGKPGKATRRESNASRRGGMLKSEKNEIMAMLRQRELRPYDPKELKRMEGQPVGKKDGGAVPAKFKGFSKLPEAVQVKMDPVAAKKYEKGGAVCRGGRSAKRGTQFRGVR